MVMMVEDEPDACECDNTHKQNGIPCRWCWQMGKRKYDDLLTEQDNPQVRALVERAAAVRFARDKPSRIRPVFEHGQWWVVVEDGRLEGNETYSVVDDTGLDFEEV
jgi:hypothetical protein